MNIIYCHHAEREVKGSWTQEDGLTKLGKKDAKIAGKMIAKHQNVKAIYTSPYFRCKETAKIINKYICAPIIEDARFNEFVRSDNIESWVDLQNRIVAALKDIVEKFNDDDTILCVTSGVNIAGFINYQLSLQASENMAFLGVISCSPIIFKFKKEK